MDDRLTAVLTDLVAAHGLDLDDVTLGGGSGNRMLRVVVDAEGGVNLDRLAEISREVSATLDTDPTAQKVLGQAPFTLEVTTRGVDRPLTLPRHWHRNQGRLVKVTVSDGSGGKGGALTGRIVGNDDERVVLAVGGRERTIALSDITRALVQVELNRKDV